MPASEAQIAANRKNAAKSTGPKTPEGKEASRANALKHGLTAVKLLPEYEAEEIESRGKALYQELRPPIGELGMILTRHLALMSVRMEYCAQHHNAFMKEKAREAHAEFEPPEGADPSDFAKLRREFEKRALFAAAPEAKLVRRYEAAAERSFFKTLKELQRMVKEEKEAAYHERMAALAPILPQSMGGLGSISPGGMSDTDFDALFEKEARSLLGKPAQGPKSGGSGPKSGGVDVPISVGKPR